MAQVNDVIKIRYGGIYMPVDATVTAVDGGGIPTTVELEEGTPLTASEFTIWSGPLPTGNAKSGRSTTRQKPFSSE